MQNIKSYEKYISGTSSEVLLIPGIKFRGWKT